MDGTDDEEDEVDDDVDEEGRIPFDRLKMKIYIIYNVVVQCLPLSSSLIIKLNTNDVNEPMNKVIVQKDSSYKIEKDKQNIGRGTEFIPEWR